MNIVAELKRIAEELVTEGSRSKPMTEKDVMDAVKACRGTGRI